MEESNVLVEDVKPEEIVENSGSEDSSKEGEISESESIKKRLGQQKKKHNREIRALQDQLAQMQSVLLSQSNPKANQNEMQNTDQQSQRPQFDPRHVSEMQKLHDEFNRDLQEASNKYDDFDDLVRDPYAPFTDSIREIAMTIDNPGEVIYSLAKNRDELYRIKDLPPHRQAKEIYKLSKALSLKDKTASGMVQPKTMAPLKGDGSTIKSSSGTPSVGDFRKMLRSGRK